MSQTKHLGTILKRWLLLMGDALYLLPVLMIPIIFSGEFNTNTLIIKEPVLHLCILFTITWIWIALFTIEKQLFSNPKFKVMSVLFIIHWIYLFVSKELIANHPNGDYEFLRWSTYFLLFLNYTIMTNSLYRLKMFATATILISFVVCMYAILQTQEWFLVYDRQYLVAWESFAWEMGGVRRVCSSLCNPDYLAGYLIAVFPLTVMTGLVYPGAIRYTSFIVAVLQILSLLFTYSRGGWISMFVTCVLMSSIFVYVNWVRNPVLILTTIKPKILITVIIMGIFMGTGIMVWQWDQVYAALYRIANFGTGHSVSSRPYFYEGAVNMIWDSPLFGQGIGMFGVEFPNFRTPDLTRILRFNDWLVDHVHNEYLEIASETGLIGLVLYGGFLLLAANRIWQALLENRVRESLLLLGLVCGIFATLFHNLFTVTLRFTPSAFLLWSFLGAAVGGASWNQNKKNEAKSKIVNALFMVAALVLVPSIFTNTVQYYVGDHLIEASRQLKNQLPKDAGVSEARRVMEAALVSLHKGARLAPFSMRGYFEQAHIYNRSVNDYVQAGDIYLHVENMQTSFTSNLRNICANYMQQANQLRERSEYFEPLAIACIQEAKLWALKAIEFDPLEPEHHYHLGRCLRELQDFEAAKVSFQNAIELIPLMQIQDRKITIQDCKDELEIIKMTQDHLSTNAQ